MTDWIAIAVLFLLDLLAKPTFWVCVAILAAGSIVSSAIERSAQHVGRRLELIAQRLRKRSETDADGDDEDEDDLLDDDL